MTKGILYIVLSAVILWVSRDSLNDPQRHGYYRFFAFETILILALLNSDYWFQDPFSPFQLVSWLLLIVSGVLVIFGFYLLRATGKPEGDIENTTELVMQGAYKYIRHPLYSSLLFLGWGAFLKNPSIVGVVLVLVITASLAATARVEERENREKFGEAYDEYMKKTKMFIPYVL